MSLGRSSSSKFLDSEDEMDLDGAEATGDKTRIIVATDFGTTFSGVAFARCDDNSQPTIHIIDGYPHDQMTYTGKPSVQVPTESWYSDGLHGIMPYPDVMDGGEDDDDQTLNYSSDSNDGNVDSVDSDIEMERPPNNQSITASNIRWGYGVQSIRPDIERGRVNLISRSKLLLDKTVHTEKIRKELRPILTRMKRNRLIKEDEDVITDYLVQLFRHAKSRMAEEHEIFEYNPIDHVLCVPAIWEAEACQKMQTALEKAVMEAEFGSIDSLFLVSEPEAAAARVLQHSGAVNEQDLFLILDAGGGTVDAITYKVTGERPLRLSTEIVPSDGCLFGSSFLNGYFREHLRKRLEGSENDISQNGYTIDGILDLEVQTFEKSTKRAINIMDRHLPKHTIRIQGLRRNDEKRLIANGVVMNRNDFYDIFRPCLREIYGLMKRQLEAARAEGHEVKKVLLVGGFGASASLRAYLREKLEALSKTCGYKITLITSTATLGEPETDVMCGAILRAWDKDNGPDRIAKISYGFEISERHEPDAHDAHKKLKGKLDPKDGQYYVRGIIDWVVIKGQVVPNQKEYPTKVYHLFPTTRKTFKYEETLWASSSDPNTSTRPHHRRTDRHNKGARIVGKITADMTSLIKQGHIQPVELEPGYIGKPHYKIEFELVIIVDGRILRFETRWPVGGPAQSKGQICIAAAFRPGTK